MIIYSFKTIFIKSYSVIFWDKNALCEFCNITGLLTEIQCKSKRLRKNFKQKIALYLDVQGEDDGADSKLVSSTTRSGKGARLCFHTICCFFIDNGRARHTLQVPSVSLQVQESMTLTQEEHHLMNTIVTAHQQFTVPLGETSTLVCIHHWQEITCNDCYWEMIAKMAKTSVITWKKIPFIILISFLWISCRSIPTLN